MRDTTLTRRKQTGDAASSEGRGSKGEVLRDYGKVHFPAVGQALNYKNPMLYSSSNDISENATTPESACPYDICCDTIMKMHTQGHDLEPRFRTIPYALRRREDDASLDT